MPLHGGGASANTLRKLLNVARIASAIVLLLVAAVGGIAWIGIPRFAPIPPMESVVNPQRLEVAVSYDTSGRSVSDPADDETLDSASAGSAGASPRSGNASAETGNRSGAVEGLAGARSADVAAQKPADGDVRIDGALLSFGREEFYRETFGDEVFLTDVMGILDGPLRPWNVAKAVLALKGQGTTNLKVELAETIRIGNVTYRKGQMIDTGLDVPAGWYSVLGMPIRVERGRVMAGITCAACHSTVDPDTKQVIDGAVNSDLAAGLLMALATNSAAYFAHGEVPSLDPYVREHSMTVLASDGTEKALPDPGALEAAVDDVFASWPPGSFDSTIDLKADPTQIPDSFTLGDHPYGWSGFAAVGPFHGLATLCNNVHAQNSDSLAQADLAPQLFGIDREVYLATILQNAASRRLRFDPASGQKPSEFFASVDPTPGAPGVNELVKPPGYPEISWIAPDGMFLASPGHDVWQQNNAMAAWQNTLMPPPARVDPNEAMAARGRVVFEKALCSGCHAGPALTDNKIVAASQIATEPTRALAFQKTEAIFGPPLTYTFDTPVPIPADPKVMLVNMRGLDPHQLDLAWAHEGTTGGYKVPSLVGLYWSAPYLHDGGVAVGQGDELGVPGTVLRGVRPSPQKSLLAFVDRNLRALVVSANDASPALRKVHVRGIGHEFWVDTEAGFSSEDQRALIHYLLTADQSEDEQLSNDPPPEPMALAALAESDMRDAFAWSSEREEHVPRSQPQGPSAPAARKR